MKPLVGIIMGSQSDLPKMEEASEVLKEFGVPCEVKVASAHRAPALVSRYAQEAASRGLEVIIAGAGMAAHLPGVIAAWTPLPVIGVPLRGGALDGVDSLHSIVQMPSGVPVATVAIDGAKNAAYLAIQILGIKFPEYREKMLAYKEGMAAKAEAGFGAGAGLGTDQTK
jgi:5-(carboxyamino)imidazole ribonucleotide mutase